MCDGDEDPKQYPYIEPEEWFEPYPDDYHMACCDCGLVHGVDFRVRNGRVQIRVRRNQRATGQLRRHREYPCTPNP